MKLKVEKRDAKSKGEINKIRHLGNIPAVIYSSGKIGSNFVINGREFNTILRKINKGGLSTIVFDLSGAEISSKAIIKDIQYHPTTYKIIHIDFQELDSVFLKVKVPITCINSIDCVGIKLGGSLRQVIRSVRVKCLPKDIPSEFILDIKDLKIGDSKRIKDLPAVENVEFLCQLNEVVAIIAKK